MARIKVILDCINSETDVNGNRYWAFRWTDTETGKQVTGTISGGESNISCLTQESGLEWNEFYYTRHVMKKREFKQLTAEWQYAGCPPSEIMAFIKNELSK